MVPILGRLGPLFIYSYTVVWAFAYAAIAGMTALLVQRSKEDWAGWVDAILVISFGGIVGGRLGFVLANLNYFSEKPVEMFQLWRGGLSYHGFLLAGWIAQAIWCRLTNRESGRYLGLLAPAVALASAFGWAACWLEGCAYGKTAAHGLLTANLPDSYGIYELRYNTQLIGFVGSLIILATVIVWWRRPHSARLFWFALMTLSGLQAALTFLRGDTVISIRSYRLDTVLNLALAAASLFFVLWLALNRRLPRDRAG